MGLVKLASASSPAEQTAAPLLGSDKPTNMTLMVVVSLSCGILEASVEEALQQSGWIVPQICELRISQRSCETSGFGLAKLRSGTLC